MTAPQWQSLFGKCGQCEQSARFDVDLAHYPHLDGRIGVRCTRCGKPSVYHFAPTPEAERQYQATHRPAALEAEGRAAATVDEWQQFHAGMLGLRPQPAEGEEEPWQPDERTLTHWQSWRLDGRGPLDRSETEEEHEHDDTRGAAEPDWCDLAGLGGDHRPGCHGD